MKKRTAHNAIIFTIEQHQFMRDNWQTMSAEKLANALGYKRTRVRLELYKMGLYKMHLEYWTEEMFQYLQANYQTKGDTEIAEEFEALFPRVKDWSKKHIEKKRRQKGLKRTLAEKQAIHQRNKERGVWADCASKMWDKVGRRPIGDIQVWRLSNGYPIKVIKTENGYVKLSHKIFTDAGNVLKKGHNLIHIDGNQLNCNTNNLELISNKELQRRNRDRYMELPAEIKELIKINNKITQKIKEHE